jgi:[ribosomal protein S5]-alanine N-acetyltransferase
VLERVQTERLVGTRPVGSDAALLAAVMTDPAVAEWYWPGEHPGDERILELMHTWVARDDAHWARHGFGPWTVRERATGGVVGRIGIGHTSVEGRDRVEVGWFVASPMWGRGYATEMATAAIDAGFAEVGLEEVVAMTLPHNAASRRVMRRLGFRFAGDIIHAGLSHVLYVLGASEHQARQPSLLPD